MIQSNELRIGNKIYGVSDRIETVTQIYSSNDVKTYIGKEWITTGGHLTDYSPIPLTEEILLKCGFEKSPYLGTIDVFNFPNTQLQVIKTSISSLPVWNFRLIGFTICEVEYLHHLQNLVFDINRGQGLNPTL